MPRPCKRRRILGRPVEEFFKPSGRRMFELEDVTLVLDEYEAIRLVDFEGNSQEEAAEKMEISQPTLSRLLSSARKKISDALVNGKAIRIERRAKT